MEWLDSESKVLDKLQTLLVNGGSPLQTGYLAAYVSVFMNAYRLGGPRSEHILEVLETRLPAGDHHAAANLTALCAAWSHWWALLGEALPRQLLTLGPRGPYDDFAAPPR